MTAPTGSGKTRQAPSSSMNSTNGTCSAMSPWCAALVSGRDLLTRLDRDDAETASAREMFEDSEESDFITLINPTRWI